ncbi:hypothetical protein BLW98_20980 [Bacillus mycoides]|nr:hypothetical protein BLW98_20980 [Bacillus mycoides]
MNNIVEQDHRFIKKRIRSMLGFKYFDTATSILSEVGARDMIKKDSLIYEISLSKIRKNSSINCLDLQYKIRLR